MGEPLLCNPTLEVVRFCAIECELQMSGPLSVANMVTAWAWMVDEWDDEVSVELITRLGMYVEPVVNAAGLRRVDVRVGNNVKPPWTLVPTLMREFLAEPPEDPVEWFREYEEIHPFRDGNGRTGVLLYNWLLGTLNHPVWPPNLWADSRRNPGFGA